jgi:hypothetical protein
MCSFIIFNLNWLPDAKYDSTNNNKRTITMTFRIDEKIMNKLESKQRIEKSV